MTNKTFLGDEVHELQADLQAARGEIELLKMNCERKDGEITIYKNQITGLKLELAQSQAHAEEKAADLVAVTTILQQTAASIGTGIQRVQRHKETRQQVANERQDRIEVARPTPQTITERIVEQTRVSEYAPTPGRPRPPVLEPADDNTPMFLHTGKVRPGIVDSRLPGPDLRPSHRDQDDILHDMNDTIGYERRPS